jgi:hypothetical protein
MADLHVGGGQAYSSIGGAVHASSNNDTVIIHSGTYNERVLLSGSTGLTFIAAGDGPVDVDVNYTSNNCFYLYAAAAGTTFQQITCSNSSYNNIYSPTTPNVLLDRLYLRQVSTSWSDELISVGSAGAGGSLTASNCVLEGPSDLGGKGVIVIGSTADFIMENCEVKSLNQAADCDGNSVFFDSCRIHSGDGSKNMAIGIRSDALNKLTASNCLIYDCGIGIDNNAFDGVAAVYNNTIHNCNTGIEAYKYFSAIDNNIIMSCSTDAIKGDGGANQPAPSNNLFFANTEDIDNYTDDASKITGTDPEFVDSASGNFYLADSSPAINSGKTVAWLTVDYAGTARPQGAKYDIGAYEFIDSGVTPFKGGMLSLIFNGNITKTIDQTLAGENRKIVNKT